MSYGPIRLKPKTRINRTSMIPYLKSLWSTSIKQLPCFVDSFVQCHDTSLPGDPINGCLEILEIRRLVLEVKPFFRCLAVCYHSIVYLGHAVHVSEGSDCVFHQFESCVGISRSGTYGKGKVHWRDVWDFLKKKMYFYVKYSTQFGVQSKWLFAGWMFNRSCSVDFFVPHF